MYMWETYPPQIFQLSSGITCAYPWATKGKTAVVVVSSNDQVQCIYLTMETCIIEHALSSNLCDILLPAILIEVQQ